MAAKRPMSAEHKAALAKGRAEGRVVRAYLEGLRATKPKRGRKRTVESVRARIDAIDQQLAEASAIEQLHLVQERRDLTAEIEQLSTTIDLDALEVDFVNVAASYGAAKGIEYATWREVGVEPRVLQLAGIKRST